VTIVAKQRIVQSAFVTSVHRYARSWGLWVLLLLAPIAARIWIGDPEGARAAIAVNGKAPIMTSATLGVSLGIVVSTLLLPAAFIYFRASVTRLQPWQIVEVTCGSRVAGAVGHYFADVAVACAALLALTLAGFIIGLIGGLPGGFHPATIAFGLWVVALPALMMAAALRRMLDALPWTRRAWGEVIALGLWIAALTAPSAALEDSRTSAADVVDLAGFVQPLTASLPAGKRDIMIGGGPDTNGKIALGVERGLTADGYLFSRFRWALLAIAMTVAAGLLYRPHLAQRPRKQLRLAALLSRPAPLPAISPATPPATAAALPFLNVVAAEFRLIGRSRAWRAAALLVAVASAAVDYRHVAGPAALLMLVFGLSAQIGRVEQATLRTLTGTMSCSPWIRRVSFVLATIGWGVAMGLPAIILGGLAGNPGPFILAVGTTGCAALVAMLLGTVTKSAFAPRLVLLVGWYIWLSL
jgi:hypothetical protein